MIFVKRRFGDDLPDGFPPVGTSLENATWDQIAAVSKAGKGNDYWNIGDVKSIHLYGTCGTLSLNTTLYCYIIGFDHNEEYEGKGITFGTWKTASGTDVCLVDSNYSSTDETGQKWFNVNHWGSSNNGGWAGCDLRYDILGSTNVAPANYGSPKNSGNAGYNAGDSTATNPVANTLMSCLPVDLRAVMKPITKYTNNYGNVSGERYVFSSVDYLPLLSQYEVFASDSSINSTEAKYQKQYAYYANGNSAKKYRHSDNSKTAIWWERSPQVSEYNPSLFSYVDSSGNASGRAARYSIGLSPIFKV